MFLSRYHSCFGTLFPIVFFKLNVAEIKKILKGNNLIKKKDLFWLMIFRGLVSASQTRSVQHSS